MEKRDRTRIAFATIIIYLIFVLFSSIIYALNFGISAIYTYVVFAVPWLIGLAIFYLMANNTIKFESDTIFVMVPAFIAAIIVLHLITWIIIVPSTLNVSGSNVNVSSTSLEIGIASFISPDTWAIALPTSLGGIGGLINYWDNLIVGGSSPTYGGWFVYSEYAQILASSLFMILLVVLLTSVIISILKHYKIQVPSPLLKERFSASIIFTISSLLVGLGFGIGLLLYILYKIQMFTRFYNPVHKA